MKIFSYDSQFPPKCHRNLLRSGARAETGGGEKSEPIGRGFGRNPAAQQGGDLLAPLLKAATNQGFGVRRE